MEIEERYFSPGGRWFVTVEIPEAIRKDLASLAAANADIRRTPCHQLHLTLRFVGTTDPETVRRIAENLGAIRVEPFLLTPQGVGRFPAKGRARVLWAGVGTGHPRLFQLQQKVEEAVIASGVTPETRRFHPHITLARSGGASPGAVTEFLKKHRDYTGGPFRVDAFSLFVSHIGREGAVHGEALRFPLG